ncbi:hypothetical protein JAAARDRAFT_209496 [Jaapia argillacea MUCL 33604]|uniref:Uncharacterized protein n=1 Tax=Jaapia argillacea MUCL 33604 TaxID=933084 RepID=A0A067PKP9_9AGAM|nr:hypothetical protein JAAARDRAFT_209496 [Jaapia argillacea MUCL 33604]
MEDEPGVVAHSNIAAMFVDWTDPQKALSSSTVDLKLLWCGREVRGQVADDITHIELATEITKALFSDDMTEVIDDDKIPTLKLHIHNLTSVLTLFLHRRPLHDTTSKNAFSKSEASVSKKLEKQLEGFGEEEYRQLESLKEQFDFLDDIVPPDSDSSDGPNGHGSSTGSVLSVHSPDVARRCEPVGVSWWRQLKRKAESIEASMEILWVAKCEKRGMACGCPTR